MKFFNEVMAEIHVYKPREIDANAWLALQTLQRDAFSATLMRPSDDICTLVNWDDPNSYIQSHQNPNMLVGTRLNAAQSYSHSRVALATDQGEVIGFAYAANNVSGASAGERFKKRITLAKNYLWLREVAVRPDYQDQGIAKQLGRALLKGAYPYQPATAYIWPEEIPFLQEKLEKYGFVHTGEQAVHVFGPDKDPVKQVRMLAPQARKLISVLKQTK